MMDAQVILEQWSQVVETQMHFNEILMQLRAIGVSVIMASYGAAAIAFVKFEAVRLTCWKVSVRPSTVVILFSFALSICLFVLDYFYYYQMLLVAVEVGRQIELNAAIPFGLARQVTFEIPRLMADIVIYIFYGLPVLIGAILLILQNRIKVTSQD